MAFIDLALFASLTINAALLLLVLVMGRRPDPINERTHRHADTFDGV